MRPMRQSSPQQGIPLYFLYTSSQSNAMGSDFIYAESTSNLFTFDFETKLQMQLLTKLILLLVSNSE